MEVLDERMKDVRAHFASCSPFLQFFEFSVPSVFTGEVLALVEMLMSLVVLFADGA